MGKVPFEPEGQGPSAPEAPTAAPTPWGRLKVIWIGLERAIGLAAAVATVGLFWIAFVTVKPAIDNLELKQANTALRDKLKVTQDDIDLAEVERDKITTQLEKSREEVEVVSAKVAALTQVNQALSAVQKQAKRALEETEQQRAELQASRRAIVIDTLVYNMYERMTAETGRIDFLAADLPIVTGWDIVNRTFTEKKLQALSNVEQVEIRDKVATFLVEHRKLFDQPISFDRVILKRLVKEEEWWAVNTALKARVAGLSWALARDKEMPPLEDPGDEIEAEVRRVATLQHELWPVFKELGEFLKN